MKKETETKEKIAEYIGYVRNKYVQTAALEKCIENGTLTVHLSTGKIVIQEPKIKVLRAMKKSGGDSEAQELYLISSVTGKTAEELDEYTADDYGIIQKGVQTFLE